MKKLIVSTITFLLVQSFLQAQDPQYLYGFYGRVAVDEEKGIGVTVNLYDGNTMISSYKTKKNAKFAIDAPENKHYTLEFVKEGFVTKRVIINTKLLPENRIEEKDFAFDVYMIQEKEGVDYSILDFPIALIEYRKSVRAFDYNKKYTRKMRDVQNEVVAGVFTQL